MQGNQGNRNQGNQPGRPPDNIVLTCPIVMLPTWLSFFHRFRIGESCSFHASLLNFPILPPTVSSNRN